MPAIVIAHEDRPAAPWVLPDGSGWDQRLVQDAARDAGLEIAYRALPWQRCLEAAGCGELDGVLAVSYRSERCQFLAYPLTADGRPDVAASLHTDSYAIYRRADRLLQPTDRVAAQRGFAVVEQLAELGIAADEFDDDAAGLLARLAGGEVAAAALLTVVADQLIALRPEWQHALTREARVFSARPYYLAFARAFYEAQPEPCSRLWQAIRARRSGGAR
ncbi:MAG: transporter substrate-binding domain-containing protein, partial [Planctomycetota bacterium]|nr:transporter substrate-binding domain-containing protein [Planctomycetota bacterium]